MIKEKKCRSIHQIVVKTVQPFFSTPGDKPKTNKTVLYKRITSLVGVGPVCAVTHTKTLRWTLPNTALFNSTGQRKHWLFHSLTYSLLGLTFNNALPFTLQRTLMSSWLLVPDLYKMHSIKKAGSNNTIYNVCT